MLTLLLASATRATGPTRKFFPDDPIVREPATQDASKAAVYEVDLALELIVNQFARPGDRATTSPRAGNVNTVDEVPDSTWFTNRIGARAMSVDELARGPNLGTPPDPAAWTVVRTKSAGASPGFTARDAGGDTWFITFDAPGYPEAGSGAIAVANKLFWALGYNQVENFITRIDPSRLTIGEQVTLRDRTGKRRAFTDKDLRAVLERAHRSADGTYRVVAARQLQGRIIGNFRYYGTRPDDPNDIVPHEHRRELRALYVFGAWTNLVDMKAGNTLDVLVDDEGRSVVKHYLQDVGSTFGTGANGPHDYDEGWEWLYEADKTWRRLATLGLYLQPWQTVSYDEHPSIGRFEGKQFDPTAWRPRVPVAAHRHLRGDDAFWAAQRVAAFSDEAIRAIVKTAEFSDPRAERMLGDILIERRNKIAQVYLPAVNPLAGFALADSGELRFTNVAVAHKVAEVPSRGYKASWFTFDNLTQQSSALGETSAPSGAALTAPPGCRPRRAHTSALTWRPSDPSSLRGRRRSRSSSGVRLAGGRWSASSVDHARCTAQPHHEECPTEQRRDPIGDDGRRELPAYRMAPRRAGWRLTPALCSSRATCSASGVIVTTGGPR